MSSDQIDKLQSQIQALEHEMQQLKGKVAAAKASPAPPAQPLTKAPTAPTAIVKMSPNNRPSICSADGLNCISLYGRVQIDAGGYNYHPNSASTAPQNLDNGVNARRARLGLLGTFMGDWGYGLIYDFGGSSDGLPPVSGAPISGIEQAYLSYSGLKPVTIEGGYLDMLYTLDEATSSADILFMERAAAVNVATGIAAGDFRSGGGIRGNTDRFFAAAYVTGPTSGTTHIFAPTTTAAGSPGTLGSPGFGEQLGAFGRVAYQVWQDKSYSAHLGGDAEFLLEPPGNNSLMLSDRPELRIDPTSLLSTGSIANIASAQVYSAEAAATAGPLFFQGEYFWYNINRSMGLPNLDFNGGYAEAAWSLTGETHPYNPSTAAYGSLVPDHPVSFGGGGGGYGAWELAARYSTINLNNLFTPGIPTAVSNGVAGGAQTIYTVGLNWYVNRNVRFSFNYLHGTEDKFSGTAASPTDVGAKFDALAMRTQVSF